MVFSAEGISPDPNKVAAIRNAAPPSSVKDVRSFLGMATYCAKFIPNFSHLSEPLRKLTTKNAQFRWTECEQRAFDNIKNALTSKTVMAYFDQTKQTELVTDASPWGLSAILAQKSSKYGDRRIVAYVSRSLSEVERKYSQTEREALAIVWAMERLQIYLRGGKFTLYTDCKPIELILGNPKSKPPARIERWNLRIQDFDFDIMYTKGHDNPSDFLSRHPCSETENTHEMPAEQYVNFLTTHAVPKAMTIQEIQEATKSDKTLQRLIEIIHTQAWSSINETATTGEDIGELKLLAKVSDVDFCGPFPTGEYTLVVIDAYSRFPEVEIVRSTSAKSTIHKLERIFATHGLPNTLKSDNGPPFQSSEFKQFMKENGIKHQRITPLWPQANSEAENFMKPMEKAIRAAHIEKKNWRTELYRFY